MMNRKISKYRRYKQKTREAIKEIESILENSVKFGFYVYESTESDSGELVFADLLLGNDMLLEEVLELVKQHKILTEEIWIKNHE